MTTFSDLLKNGISEDLPSVKEVFIDRVKKSKKFNTGVIGQHIFCPGPDYEKDYSLYAGLHYKQRVKSDGNCRDIWGVTNPELYRMWYDHINNTNKYPEIDRLVNVGNELLNDDDMGEKVYSTRIALLTPEEMVDKGVYNREDPDMNYYKIAANNVTIDNGVRTTDWFTAYKLHFNGVSSEKWNELYIPWKTTIKKLSYNLKNARTEEETKAISQSLLELGWIPGVEFSTKNLTIQRLVKPRSKKPIDITRVMENFELSSTPERSDWLLIIFIINKDYCTPFISLDFENLYKYNNGGLLHTKAELILRSNSILSVVGFSIDKNISSFLEYKLQNYKEDFDNMNILGFDINNTIKTTDIKDNIDIVLKLFLKAILKEVSIEDRDIPNILTIPNANRFMLFDEVPYSEINPKIIKYLENPEILNTTESMTMTKEFVLSELEKNPSKLTLMQVKPIAEKTMVGLERELFDIIYEKCIGKDIESTIESMIHESVNESIKYDIITEGVMGHTISNVLDSLTKEFNNLKNKYQNDPSENAARALWQYIKKLDASIYKEKDPKNKSEKHKLRKEAMSLFNNITIKLKKKNPNFNIKKLIGSVSSSIKPSHIDTKHIKHSVNLLKSKK